MITSAEGKQLQTRKGKPMARKKKLYLVLDTETTTLSGAGAIANGDENKKKAISIMRPIIYDIGWTVCDRFGNIQKKQNFIISEVFYNVPIMNEAYYSDRRPQYEQAIEAGTLKAVPWAIATKALIEDLQNVDAVGAFNASFDFFKAIPYTELYIGKSKLPVKMFNEWLDMQKQLAKKIANEKYQREEANPDYNPDIFKFRGVSYNLFDLWGMACKHTLNNNRYKDFCLENGYLTSSGTYFKSSAEVTFRYLSNNTDFDEAHTALNDAEIESAILGKITSRHSISGVISFPFRMLGDTDEYVMTHKGKARYKSVVINTMETYLESYTGGKSYRSQIENKIAILKGEIEEE